MNTKRINQTDTIRASFVEPENTGRMMDGDKEQTDSFHLVAVKGGGEIREIATVRVWMGRSKSASVVHASCWVHAQDHQRSGRGSAGGWGYCKTSQAVADAISAAGIRFTAIESDGYSGVKEKGKRKPWTFGGTGRNNIENALLAIGRAMGYRRLLVVRG